MKWEIKGLSSKLDIYHNYIFYFEKLHGKDLEHASRSQFRPGMCLKVMSEMRV